jgi:hypothetical protein
MRVVGAGSLYESPYFLIFEELMLIMAFVLGCENFILGFGCGI